MSTIAVNTITPATGSSVSIPSFVPAAAFSFRNKFINGTMAISQRWASTNLTITAAAALAYAIDRWYAYCTGANVTGQRITGTAPNQYNYRFTGAASVTKIGFAQRIEAANCQDLAGTTATLSVDLANSLLTTVTWTAWYANTADTFGTLASPTRTQIATGTFTVSSTLARYSTQISIPSAATTGIEVEFSVGAQTSGTWTIGEAQLEAGSVATPFEYRPIGVEIALCQRYYVKTYDIDLPPANASSNGIIGNITTSAGLAYASFTFPVSMRVAPTTVTLYNGTTGATGTWRDGGATDRAVSVAGAGMSSLLVVCTTAAASSSISGHAVAIAEL